MSQRHRETKRKAIKEKPMRKWRKGFKVLVWILENILVKNSNISAANRWHAVIDRKTLLLKCRQGRRGIEKRKNELDTRLDDAMTGLKLRVKRKEKNSNLDTKGYDEKTKITSPILGWVPLRCPAPAAKMWKENNEQTRTRTTLANEKVCVCLYCLVTVCFSMCTRIIK